MIYIDAQKERKELDICRRLWPKAILTGDDYWWEQRRKAITRCRSTCSAFAQDHGLRVLHRRHTWVLTGTRVPWFWRWVDRLRPSDEPGA